MILFTNQTANGTSTTYEPGINNTAHTLVLSGTLGGAVVKVQTSVDNSNWTDVAFASLTEPTTLNFVLNTIYLRLDISGASSTTDVDAAIQSSDKIFFFDGSGKLSDVVESVDSVGTSLSAFKTEIDGRYQQELLEGILKELKKNNFYLSYFVDFEVSDEELEL